MRGSHDPIEPVPPFAVVRPGACKVANDQAVAAF
jgi:hypothetical protein